MTYYEIKQKDYVKVEKQILYSFPSLESPRNIDLRIPMIKLHNGKWFVFTSPVHRINTDLVYKAAKHCDERNVKEGRYGSTMG